MCRKRIPMNLKSELENKCYPTLQYAPSYPTGFHDFLTGNRKLKQKDNRLKNGFVHRFYWNITFSFYTFTLASKLKIV